MKNPSKIQQILTQAMQKLAPVVDRFARRASKINLPKRRQLSEVTQTGLRSPEGQDFGQIRWEQKQLQSLVGGIESTKVQALIPNLHDKKVLHLTPGNSRHVSLLMSRGATNLLELDATNHIASHLPAEAASHLVVRGAVTQLPFPEDSFDFILYPAALSWRAEFSAVVPELERCLKPNGWVLISTIHPFFEYLINPRGGFQKGIGAMVSQLRQHRFFVEEIWEGNLAEATRHVALPKPLVQQLKAFPEVPVVLLLRAILLRKKK